MATCLSRTSGMYQDDFPLLEYSDLCTGLSDAQCAPIQHVAHHTENSFRCTDAFAPWLLFLAMSLCAIGNTLTSRETETMFMVGNGAFAAGNLTYVALFLAPPTSDSALILTRPVIFRLLLVLATRFTLRAGNLKSPVPAYIPIILGIAFTVLALPDAGALYRAFLPR